MIVSTVYAETGKIVKIITCKSFEEIETNLEVDEWYKVGRANYKTQYVKDDEFRDYPEKPGEWAAFDYVNEVWFDPRTPADLEAEAVEALRFYRSRLNPYARAFFQALAYFPFPPAEHMLQAYNAHIATLTDYDPLRIWNDRVVQIIRLHPDMDHFGATFGVTPEQIDMICEVAMNIEEGLITA